MDDREADLVRGKLQQAEQLLSESGLDCWLVFCRETSEIPEPALALVLGADVVWETAFILTPSGDHHAVVGRYDAPPVEELGSYTVHAYDESVVDPLLDVLHSLDPDTIGLDYSTEEVAADGLTHGLYRRLVDILSETPYIDRFVSAEDIVTGLRSTKTDIERERMREAATITESLLEEAIEHWTPETTERDLSEYIHGRMEDEGLDSAWGWDHCPAVDAGAGAPIGHSLPGDRTVPPGEVLHFDFGVRYRGYAADIQRLYYHPENGDGPPTALLGAVEDVRAAIEAARDTLVAGVEGHVVDTAARETITERGWDEFQHAVGHTVGRNAHDAGTLLGPRWERYGTRPEQTVSEGEIYTLELGVDTEWGYLGLEELLEVTEDGAQYFHEPQRELRILTVE
jgi:Xaa-Pro aminopeptidase